MIRKFLNLKFKLKLTMSLLEIKTKFFSLTCLINSKTMASIFHFLIIEELWKVALRRLLIVKSIFLVQIQVNLRLFSRNCKKLKLIRRWRYKAMANSMFSGKSNKQKTFKFKSQNSKPQAIEYIRSTIGARRIYKENKQ